MAVAFPKGWMNVNLEEVVEILDSMRVPVNNKERQSRIEGKSASQLFPYYGATGEVGKINGYLFNEDLVALGEDGVPFYDHLKTKAYLLSGKTWVNNHAHVLKGWPDGLNNKILLHYLNQFDYHGYVNGGTRLKLTQANMRKIPVPLPPLAEQKVIADKLDTLLAQVETTKARLERIPQILKTFRQSVLNAAVSGKLTEDWRESNHFNVTKEERLGEIRDYKYQAWIAQQEAKYEAKGKWPKTDSWKRKYKESEIAPEFQQRELPKGWVYQPLDGLVYISARIGWKGLKASEYTESGPLFLSVHSLNYGREVKLSEAFHISEERYDESPEIMLKNDDILLCKDGAGIGKIGIVKNLQEPATINSSLLLIRSGKFFIPEFLYFFLAGPTMQRLVQERMTGSAVPHLFQRDVKEFVLEVPPLEEQAQIVRRVEELFAFADSIEEKANAALTRVNNLTQSILAKAFRGELTEQWRKDNPELITGENSAEALLVKIKAEREVLASKKKPKKRKPKGKAQKTAQ